MIKDLIFPLLLLIFGGGGLLFFGLQRWKLRAENRKLDAETEKTRQETVAIERDQLDKWMKCAIAGNEALMTAQESLLKERQARLAAENNLQECLNREKKKCP